MKKIFTIILTMSIGLSLMGSQLTSDYGSGIGQKYSNHYLLNEKATTRSFGLNSSTHPPKTDNNLLNSLGIGFVVANTTSINSFKNNVFYKKATDTGNPYTTKYASVSNWIHLEMNTPIINIMYENSFPIWSTFSSSPRYSRMHFNFYSLGYSTRGISGAVWALIAPHVTHTNMSTRDYSNNTWDFKVLYLIDYKMTTETFLGEDFNPYRVKKRQIYYLGMSSYLELMSGFSRYLQIIAVRDGYEPYEFITLPILPFFDLYNETHIREEYSRGEWVEKSREKSKLNMEIGIMYSHDFCVKKVLIQPYFKWLLYSSKNKKAEDGTYPGEWIPESRIDASISIQYVF